MPKREVVAYLVNGGKPQLSSWLLDSDSTYGVIKHNNSVTAVTCRSEVGKPLDSLASVVAVNFVNYVDV